MAPFRWWIVGMVAWIGTAVVPNRAAAAPQSDAGSSTTVELPESYGPPGADVTLPVDLRTAPATRVGSLELHFTIPSSALTLKRAALSRLAEEAGVQMALNTAPGAGAGTTDVTLRLRAAPGKAAGLPAGAVGFIVLTIASSALPGTVIPIRPRVVARAAGESPAAIQPIEVPETEVAVTVPDVASCFFYMH